MSKIDCSVFLTRLLIDPTYLLCIIIIYFSMNDGDMVARSGANVEFIQVGLYCLSSCILIAPKYFAFHLWLLPNPLDLIVSTCTLTQTEPSIYRSLLII